MATPSRSRCEKTPRIKVQLLFYLSSEDLRCKRLAKSSMAIGMADVAITPKRPPDRSATRDTGWCARAYEFLARDAKSRHWPE
jgi:hypothetical protein